MPFFGLCQSFKSCYNLQKASLSQSPKTKTDIKLFGQNLTITVIVFNSMTWVVQYQQYLEYKKVYFRNVKRFKDGRYRKMSTLNFVILVQYHIQENHF